MKEKSKINVPFNSRDELQRWLNDKTRQAIQAELWRRQQGRRYQRPEMTPSGRKR